MVDYTTLIIGLIFLPYILFQRLGGYPEAWYRISRKPYFIDYIRGPDKRYRRHCFPLTAIEHHSPAMYDFAKATGAPGSRMYGLPESEAALSVNGATMYFHAWDEFRAIPQYMDTVQNADGTTSLQFRPKVPPSIIGAGFKSTVAKEIHREEAEHEGPSGFKWYTVVALGVVIMLIIGVLYFEYSNYCGIHAHAC